MKDSVMIKDYKADKVVVKEAKPILEMTLAEVQEKRPDLAKLTFQELLTMIREVTV